MRSGGKPERSSNREIVDVWSWNFDAAFSELLAAVSSCGDDAILALDTEFPGFLREEKQHATRSARYAALRQNCDNLRPIQLGVSLAGADGVLCGTWCFNLLFDVAVDLHTEESIGFLVAAGLNFPRHSQEGIEPAVFGRRLASSPLVGRCSRPWWVTFQGSYDFGYILRLITNWRLPKDLNAYEDMRSSFFPQRYELRDEIPKGSLDSLIRENGVERQGSPHTAGSDALATLELFLQVRREGARMHQPTHYAASMSDASTVASWSDTMDGGGSSGSWAPGWGEDMTSTPLGLQALDELTGTRVGASGARYAMQAEQRGHHGGLQEMSEWDEALALQEGLFGNGGWDEVQVYAEDEASMGHWEMPSGVHQASSQLVQMENMQAPVHSMQAQDPSMYMAQGYVDSYSGNSWNVKGHNEYGWHNVSDGTWPDNNSDMSYYSMPFQEMQYRESKQFWPEFIHADAG
mmetsp:Transcript_63438/g.112787  ORF Transcript_63438/g.112787 Transcript_63438/m.112787 type:complete len:463 (-) Transcript_63438:100-1488(-)